MDGYTQRLVERYGLDRRARELECEFQYNRLIKGLCEGIEIEKDGPIARCVRKRAYKVPYPSSGKTEEGHQWSIDREQARVSYLQNMLETWDLKPKNKKRVAGLAAYTLVHSHYIKKANSHPKAQELLQSAYKGSVAKEIIREWQKWIDHRFDNECDI